MADKHFCGAFLALRDPVKLRFCIVKFHMGIGIQRDADVRMAHDILQGFRVHAALSHVGTECMAADMGRDFGKRHLVNAVVFLQDMLKVMLPVQGDHGHVVFVQKQKTSISVDHRFFQRSASVFDDPAEAGHHLVAHGDEPLAVLGFGVLNDILHVPCALELMIHPDPLVPEIDV